MLRFHLSDEVFFRTLKRFLHEYAFQPIETQDFMNTVKAVSGRDMAWFFRQWVLQPGHPVFDIRYDWIAETSKVKLTVKQTQETSRGVPEDSQSAQEEERLSSRSAHKICSSHRL